MQLLIRNGADLNVRGLYQRTALHWACERGNEAAVQHLVEGGADVNAAAFTWTAGLLAARKGYMSIVHHLVEHGGDVNTEDLFRRTTLYWVAKHGDTALVKFMEEKGTDLNAVAYWGRTALMWAVEQMQQSVVQALLTSGAKVDVRARHHVTAFHIAACIGCEEIVQPLVDGGADTESETLCFEVTAHEEYQNGAIEAEYKSLNDLVCQRIRGQEGMTEARRGKEPWPNTTRNRCHDWACSNSTTI